LLIPSLAAACPVSSFPVMLDKHYDHVAVEKDKYERWVKAGYFTAGR
jgi:hypothetical protein